jgi:AraC-like DNA-binding protein
VDHLSELSELIERHSESGSGLLTNVSLLLSRESSEPHTEVFAPGLAVVAQGHKVTTLGTRDFEYGPGSFLVTSVELPMTGRFISANPDEPFLAMIMELEPSAVAALLLETDPGERPRHAIGALGLSLASDELLDASVRLLRLLDQPQDAPALAPVYEREILWLLLRSDQGPLVREIGLSNGNVAAVARAIEWIRRHYADKLRVDDLAAIANSSVSAFHRQFRAVTLLTPIQYQKRIRLQEARALLLSDSDTVSAVAFAVGYESPSQFSRDYRRLFGLAPSDDARRLRLTSTGSTLPDATKAG